MEKLKQVSVELWTENTLGVGGLYANVCRLAKDHGFYADAVFIEVKIDFSGEGDLDGFKEVIDSSWGGSVAKKEVVVDILVN